LSFAQSKSATGAEGEVLQKKEKKKQEEKKKKYLVEKSLTPLIFPSSPLKKTDNNTKSTLVDFYPQIHMLVKLSLEN
jgi:hypothetical protein